MIHRRRHTPFYSFIVLLSFLAVGLVTPFSRAQDVVDSVNLRPQWEAGQTARYELWTVRNRVTNATIMGNSREATVTMEVTGEATWRVDRVKADGSSICTMTLDWLAVTMANAEGQKQTIDSRKGSGGDNAAMHELLKAMTGKALRVDVAADGSVDRVDGVEAIRRQVQMEALKPDELDFIESASDLATLPFAPAGAKLNDRWPARYKWSHELGYLHHDVTYQLASIEDIAGISVATVTGQGKLKLEVDRSKMPSQGPKPTIKLVGGTYETQVMFDLNRHEAVGRNNVQNTTIDMSMAFEQGSMNIRTREKIQSQVLRIEE